VKKTGKHAQAAISYAVTPVHTVDAYVALAVKMQNLGADSICIKDMAGLLKPYDAATLTRAIKQKVSLPLQIHSHATTGMSVAALIKAVEAGAELLDTTISSMSMGTSHSPTETIVEILQGTEWDTGLDLALLNEISMYFRDVRCKYKAFESAFLGADTRILVSQVPGGMLSNLESQLREQGAADKMDAVLTEIATVQKDFGYPPLVTPTSQIVGTQAVMNVLFGRYKRLAKESCHLLIGQYGATPVAPDKDLVKNALRELNLSQPVTARPADAIPTELPRLEKELAEKTGRASVSREDVLTYAMFPQVALKFFQTRADGPIKIKEPVPKAPDSGRTGGPGRYVVTVDGRSVPVTCEEAGGKTVYSVEGQKFAINVVEGSAAAPVAAPASTAQPGQGTAILAPMPADVIKLSCEEGAEVEENQTVVILEALKLQMEIKSTKAGNVHYRIRPGEHVLARQVLAEIT